VIGDGGHIPWTTPDPENPDPTGPDPTDPNPADPAPTPDPTDPGPENPDPIDHDDENEVVVEIPVNQDGGSIEEIIASSPYAPVLSPSEAASISGRIGGGNVASLKDAPNTQISASRQKAADKMGAAAAGLVKSLIVRSATGYGGAVVFRPSFALSARSNTLGGESVAVPGSPEEFDAAMVFRLEFQNGAKADLGVRDDMFPGLILFGGSAVVTTAAKLVLVDGPVTDGTVADGPVAANADWSEGGAGFRIDGRYLFLYDGVRDGKAELISAVLKKDTGQAPPRDPQEPPVAGDPEGGGGGGGCSAGAGNTGNVCLLAAILAAAFSSAFSSSRKKRT
jgi:hypothetical protein